MEELMLVLVSIVCVRFGSIRRYSVALTISVRRVGGGRQRSGLLGRAVVLWTNEIVLHWYNIIVRQITTKLCR